ncbi:MAG: TolB family protein, partial [Anaerolineae bacterium]
IDQLRTLPLDGGEGREILRSERLRGIALSTDRSWLAYTVSGSTSTGINGLWIAATRAGSAPPRRLDGRFGAFRWRDGRRLVIIPFETGAASHRLLELDAESGAERALTDPAVTPLRIADGDWSLSPDGRHVAYTNAQDDAVWVMALP